MQTNFTDEQLKDPAISVANSILRTCVHCGFCTATCPTFVLLGDELDSPRGRIYLIKDMLERGVPATEQVVRHVDRCLSCLACMTTCPSGVNYMHLVDHARRHIEETYKRPLKDRLMRGMLAWLLPYPSRFRVAMRLGGLARPFRALMPKRLRAMLELMPASLPAQIAVDTTPVEKPRARVALLAGCAQTVLDPEINAATRRLLARMGVEVIVPPEAGCCGALTHHMGKHDSAMSFARANIEAWSREIDGAGLDAVIINTSGCGTTVKDYGFMFRTEDDAIRAKAEKISALAMDISEFLVRMNYAPTREAPDLTVAYHAACSLQHGQKITAEPKMLLKSAGFRIVEPTDPHLCCGSAGTYNMLQPELSGQLRTRKLETLKRKNPDVIAAGNIGCMMQLSGDGIPVVHTVELLDWMAGGPEPVGLRGKAA